MRISFSSMETYKQCPLKYKFKEVNRLKEPKSKEAVFGTIIHATLKYMYDPALIPPGIEDALDYYSKNWNSDVYEVEAEERAAFSQGVKIIQDYYERNAIEDATIVDLESRFAIEIGPEDDRHIVSGIVDRIDRTKDGYEIIDYKTGKKMPSQDDIDHNLQLSIYLLAFLKRYPKEYKNLENITVSLYFLKHGQKLSSTRTVEQLEEVEQEFLDVIAQINEKIFEPIVTPLCGWCGFQRECPMWRHKFKDERQIDSDEVHDMIKSYVTTKNNMTTERRELAVLQKNIITYMDQEGVERVFDDDGIVARSERKTYKYNEESLRELLEPKGLWDEVTKIDGIALKKVATALGAKEKRTIEKAKEIKSTSQSLSVKKKE